MRKAIVVTAVCLAFPHIVLAQPQRFDGMLTLNEAVARVQSVGFDVRAARGEAQMAAGDAASARAALRPQISISGIALDANEPQLGMPIARQAYGQASLSVPLLTPSSGPAARAAAYSLRAASFSVDAAANDAVYMTVQAYRRAQFGAAVLVARHVDVEDQQDHLRLTQLRVAAGKLPRYTLARDRAALAVAQQNEEDAASEAYQARNDLAALLDLDVPSRIGIEPLMIQAIDEPRDAVLARALRQRPSLLAAEQRMRAAQADLEAARGAYFPSASFTAQSYNGASSPNLGPGGGQVQFTATLPIIDGGSRAAAVTKAKGEVDRATALRDQARLGVERDIANAYRELDAAQRNLATAQAGQSDAEEQLRVARVREHAGKGIDLEVLDALAVAGNARENVLRSLTRYDNAIAAVRHAAGDRTL